MLRELLKKHGNLLYGVAEVEKFKSGWLELPDETVSGLKFGISIGLPLSRKVLCSIKDCPTKLYSYHYKQVNYYLDRIGVLVTNFIQSEGYNALPIPASQTIDKAKLQGHVNHREIAEAAGLGWRGRNNLLVNPKYGSAIRLVTVLTDYPLEVTKPLKENCGSCTNCIEMCPAGSIKLDSLEFDLDSCYKKLCEFQKLQGVGHHICGICVKACTGKETEDE